MAAPTTPPSLLDTLTQSLASASDVTPKLASIKPPPDGVSLLDVKNELLLTYLQNLVFLILLKIRRAKDGESASEDESSYLSDNIIGKLVELRLYLEKGVRPLEEKLRYQLDKILRAADDEDRSAEARQHSVLVQDEESHADSGDEQSADETIDGANMQDSAPSFNLKARRTAAVVVEGDADKTGVYRPPKITPTVMPTTDRREMRERRPVKSATMDEYISNELSTAPLAEPSVGTTIVSGGRKIKTAAERAEEDRRREYEETNFVRLPKESKKERAARKKIEGRSGKMQFGGEDWRDISEGVDRINRSTRRKEGSSSVTRVLLEKSRKRTRETTDGDRGSGFSTGTRPIGERFAKKVKVMEGGRRDRGNR